MLAATQHSAGSHIIIGRFFWESQIFIQQWILVWCNICFAVYWAKNPHTLWFYTIERAEFSVPAVVSPSSTVTYIFVQLSSSSISFVLWIVGEESQEQFFSLHADCYIMKKKTFCHLFCVWTHNLLKSCLDLVCTVVWIWDLGHNMYSVWNVLGQIHLCCFLFFTISSFEVRSSGKVMKKIVWPVFLNSISW